MWIAQGKQEKYREFWWGNTLENDNLKNEKMEGGSKLKGMLGRGEDLKWMEMARLRDQGRS